MALKAKLDSVEDLSSDIQSHYVEKDGTFFLDVTTVEGLELSDTRGLKSALSKEKTQVKAAKKQLEEFADIDPIKAREALAKIDEIANWTPEGNAKDAQELFEKQLTDKLDKERTVQLAKFTSEQKVLSDRNGVLEKQLHKTMIGMKATKAITDADGVPELLLHTVTSAMQIREEEGNFRTVIVDNEGNPRMSSIAGEYDKLMTADQFVSELKENKVLAPAFKGTGASGTGAKNSNSPLGGKKHTMTEEDAADYNAWKKASEAAEKDGTVLTVISK